jgi:hypothetical protein
MEIKGQDGGNRCKDKYNRTPLLNPPPQGGRKFIDEVSP